MWNGKGMTMNSSTFLENETCFSRWNTTMRVWRRLSSHRKVICDRLSTTFSPHGRVSGSYRGTMSSKSAISLTLSLFKPPSALVWKETLIPLSKNWTIYGLKVIVLWILSLRFLEWWRRLMSGWPFASGRLTGDQTYIFRMPEYTKLEYIKVSCLCRRWPQAKI